jgi:hypothetical protein
MNSYFSMCLSLSLALKCLHCLLYQSSLSQPQMMVVADLDDVFLPLPDDLLVNLVDSRHVVESFLDSLPSMFQDNVNVESALGPALKAAFMVMVCYLFSSIHIIFGFDNYYEMHIMLFLCTSKISSRPTCWSSWPSDQPINHD